LLPENISMIDCICNTVGRDDDYDRSDENKYRDDDDDDDEEEEDNDDIVIEDDVVNEDDNCDNSHDK